MKCTFTILTEFYPLVKSL